ncbi:MAG: class I SAM-dependent methyltransferase, partial [Acetobacteraceae bacterium]
MKPDEPLDLQGLVTRASLWPVERLVQPYAWISHIPFAFWLVGASRPRLVVELGTHTGNSFFAFCQAAETHGTGSRLVAVDTWTGDAHAGTYGGEVFRDVSTFRDARYAGSA